MRNNDQFIKTIQGFVEYVLSFYARGEMYDIAATEEEVRAATTQYLMKSPDKWGGGDSVDREFVRDIILESRREAA